MMIQEITPEELYKKRQQDEDSFILLDVRRQEERAFSHIGGILIPLDELEERYQELDSAKEIVIYCHHGVRSLYACQFLLSQGFKNVRNLTGGIDLWSQLVDHNIKRY